MRTFKISKIIILAANRGENTDTISNMSYRNPVAEMHIRRCSFQAVLSIIHLIL